MVAGFQGADRFGTMGTDAVAAELKTSASLQKEGNACFGRGEHAEALRKYAAALAGCPPKSDEERVRHAQLRSNRALCCLRLEQYELALAEAQQCKELRPDWAKAYYRLAAAQDGLGRLGDARVTLHEARRLEASGEILAALAKLSARLFPPGTERLGEALNTLEDFQCDTSLVLRHGAPFGCSQPRATCTS